MRKIVSGLFVSLDGVVQDPQNWHFPYINDEMVTVIGEQVDASDTMLLGRHTYEQFAGYWPQQGSEVELADHMNNVPKLVVSTTLERADWQHTTIIRSPVEELAALKEQPGRNINIVGSPTLARRLLHDGLLDELDLLVHPIVVGSGQRLFPDGSDRQPLTLISADTFKTGVLRLRYRRA
jgi:dihydrofolate reductase